MRILKIIFCIVAILYLAIISYFLLAQRHYIYHPLHESQEDAEASAAALGLKPWQSADGSLLGWVKPNPSAPFRAIVFHGNTKDALSREYYAKALGDVWEVYLFEYPGFGFRQGNPSQSVLTEAAQEAVETLLDPSAPPVILIGESLGSGVASQVASRIPQVAGILFVTPFYNLTDPAKKSFPWLPINFILWDKYDSGKALQNYHGTIAVVVAGEDTVVPPASGKRLYETYSGAKKLWILEGVDHSTVDFTPQAKWWSEARQFLENPSAESY